MGILSIVSILLSIMGMVSGLIASFYWFSASRIEVTPIGGAQSGDSAINTMSWVVGNMDAFTRSGSLNKWASMWTAVAVLLSTLASVCSTVT
jgi:hypothetical protein